MSDRVTPVEERIDQRERALIEKAATATVGVYPESDHIEAVMDLRELGQVAKRLLAEHSAREALERIATETRHVESMAGGCVGAELKWSDGMRVNCPRCFAEEALAALPATESAQPEEERHG